MSGAVASCRSRLRKPLASGLKPTTGRLAPSVSSATRGPVMAERAVARERAAEHIDGEHRAETVADDHHLVGLALVHRVGDVAGEGIQPLAPILPLAVDELVDGGGLVAALQQPGDRFAQPEHGGEAADPGDAADNFRDQRRRAERGDQVHAQDADERAEQQPYGDQQDRREGDSAKRQFVRSMRPKAPLSSAIPVVRYICTIFHQGARAKSLRTRSSQRNSR